MSERARYNVAVFHPAGEWRCRSAITANEVSRNTWRTPSIPKEESRALWAMFLDGTQDGTVSLINREVVLASKERVLRIHHCITSPIYIVRGDVQRCSAVQLAGEDAEGTLLAVECGDPSLYTAREACAMAIRLAPHDRPAAHYHLRRGEAIAVGMFAQDRHADAERAFAFYRNALFAMGIH